MRNDELKKDQLRNALREIERLAARHEHWAQPPGSQPSPMSRIGELARLALATIEADNPGEGEDSDNDKPS